MGLHSNRPVPQKRRAHMHKHESQAAYKQKKAQWRVFVRNLSGIKSSPGLFRASQCQEWRKGLPTIDPESIDSNVAQQKMKETEQASAFARVYFSKEHLSEYIPDHLAACIHNHICTAAQHFRVQISRSVTNQSTFPKSINEKSTGKELASKLLEFTRQFTSLPLQNKMQEKDPNTAPHPNKQQEEAEKEVSHEDCKSEKKPEHQTDISNAQSVQSEMQIHPEEISNVESIDDLIHKWLSDPDAFE